MKANNILKFTFVILILLFIGLYISQVTGYYEYTESKKTTLTKDAINRFEKDVKEGKEISAKNYLEEEKEYNNKVSKLGITVSNLIEKSFNKTMSSLFKEIDRAVSEK